MSLPEVKTTWCNTKRYVLEKHVSVELTTWRCRADPVGSRQGLGLATGYIGNFNHCYIDFYLFILIKDHLEGKIRMKILCIIVYLI